MADGGGPAAGATADVFVVFGITGDLAKVMTFRSSIASSDAAARRARSSGWPSTTGPSTT